MSFICNNAVGYAISFIGGLAVATAVCKPRQTVEVCNYLYNNRICKGSGIGLVVGSLVSAIILKTSEPFPSTTMANVGASIALAIFPPVFGAVAGGFVGGLSSLGKRITVSIN